VHRFPVDDVRVFKGAIPWACAASPGRDDNVIAMAVIRHTEVSPEERAGLFQTLRRLASEEAENGDSAAEEARRDRLGRHRDLNRSALPKCRRPRSSF